MTGKGELEMGVKGGYCVESGCLEMLLPKNNSPISWQDGLVEKNSRQMKGPRSSNDGVSREVRQ